MNYNLKIKIKKNFLQNIVCARARVLPELTNFVARYGPGPIIFPFILNSCYNEQAIKLYKHLDIGFVSIKRFSFYFPINCYKNREERLVLKLDTMLRAMWLDSETSRAKSVVPYMVRKTSGSVLRNKHKKEVLTNNLFCWIKRYNLTFNKL